MHYSGDAIRRSLRHFVLGKGITAVSAVVLLLALAKLLPTADFAVYATLQAVVLVIGAATSFGLNQVALRYLPEMRAEGQNRPLYALAWRTAIVRLLVTSGAFAACGLALPWVAVPLGFGEQASWVLAYFAVGVLRLTSQFLSSAMEALLWPKVSQYALAAAALLKLGLIVALSATGRLDLGAVVLVEGVAEAVALALLAAGLRRMQRSDPRAGDGDPDWVRRHRDRLRRFGRWNYATTLVTQLATTSPYRLLAPVLLTTDKTALLGLVYSLVDLLYRFMPARMARLLLRSILVARHDGGVPTATLAPLNLSFRLNAVLVALAAACALAGGSGALATLTGGRYLDAGPLLAAAVSVLLLDLWRVNHDLLASVTERVRCALWANAGLAAGVVVALLGAPVWGLWALPMGAAAGQVAAIALYLFGLRDLEPRRMVDMRTLVFFGVALAIGAGFSRLPPDVHWGTKLAGTIAAFAAAAALLQPITWAQLRQLTGPRPAQDRGPTA